MTSTVDQRDLAKRQRRHLKKAGFPERDIQAFAELFTTDPDTTDTPEIVPPPCEVAT